MITPDQIARIQELDRLLRGQKHAHNPGRALWEAERYRILADTPVTFASDDDARKGAVLQTALADIAEHLVAISGRQNFEGLAHILLGDRQRLTAELMALNVIPVPEPPKPVVMVPEKVSAWRKLVNAGIAFARA